MTNWLESMTQTFEYYTVDPNTWMDDERMRNVTACTITRDSTSDTLASATFDVKDFTGECYIRVYLITIQNGERSKYPLGTFLVQTPSSDYDGKVSTVSMDAYSPLLELSEKKPDIGYSLFKNDNIMENVYRIARSNMRAPVVRVETNDKLTGDFVSSTDDTWLAFLSDLLSNAKYELELDELGKVLFAPKQELVALQPVWTYNDDNSSILYPEVSLSHDLYGVPNVVEVLYSSGNGNYYSRIVNDDENSPTSTVKRGREIVYRETSPSFAGSPSQAQVDEYAEKLLKSLSSVEYTVSYTHAYCPVRVGDCVRLNYSRAGLENVKAKVISQSITCESGCPVSEKAVFTTNLWR